MNNNSIFIPDTMKTFTVSFCLISQILFEFISCGCPNKASQMERLKQYKLVVSQSGAWMAEVRVSAGWSFKAVRVNLLQAVLQLALLLVILVIP